MNRPTANAAWAATLEFLRRNGRLVVTLGLGTIFLAQVLSIALLALMGPQAAPLARLTQLWAVVGEFAIIAVVLSAVTVGDGLRTGGRALPWTILLGLVGLLLFIVLMIPVGLAAQKAGYSLDQLVRIGNDQAQLKAFVDALPGSAKLYMFVLSLAFIFVYVRLLFWRQALVGDRIGLLTALGDSWRATAGRFWALLGLLLLFAIVTGILSWAATAVIGSLLILALGQATGGLLTALIVAFLLTFPTIVWVVFLTFYWRRPSNGI